MAAARTIAVAADLFQIALAPAVLGGAASPVNDAVDVAVGIALVALVGWHWAFLPTFVSELIPIWDLVPTWTAATWLATQKRIEDRGLRIGDR